MSVTWQFGNKLGETAPIEDLEQELQTILPRDYVECVLENNAGYPSLHTFETQSGEQHVFSDLLSVVRSDDNNIYQAHEAVSDRLGRRDILPFAADPFGNYLCFNFDNSSASVVYWSHETNTLHTVTRTFSDLINMLHP